MNCRNAENLLHAERDRVLTPEEAADLERHLGACAACQRTRVLLAESAQAWKERSSAAAAPDSLVEWQAVRRRLRSGERVRHFRDWRRPAWVCGGLAAAGAALAFALLPVIRDRGDPRRQIMPRAEFVEFADADATPVVYLDAETGWLVVWSVGDGPNSRS